MARNPATRQEITDRLIHYGGTSALEEIATIAQLVQSSSVLSAVERLAVLDANIGGFGIHTLLERGKSKQRSYDTEDRPIYRPIQYVQMYLTAPNFEWRARNAAEMACAHIEGLVKRFVERRNLLERMRSSPLGRLLHQRAVKYALPVSVWEDLCWLNDAVYVQVKHNYSVREIEEPEEVEERKGHLFSVEEALAIYVISRYLAVEIGNSL